MICPNCRQDVAPIVRGVRSYCTACGGSMPFTAAPEAVNVAGQPAKVGGGIATAFGWFVLGLGMLVSFGMGAAAGALFTLATAMYVGGFFAVLALLVGVPLLLAGKKLQQSGASREQQARERAVLALAAKHRGVLTVPNVSRALEIQDADADALLTALAKRPDGKVTLEVDDSGTITYVFRDLVAAAAPQPQQQRVRVGGEGWRVPNAEPAKSEARVIDAELIEEEAAHEADAAARRMTR